MVQLAANPRRCASSPRRTRRAELRLTAWHNQVAKPVIAAVNGVCAGGGLHFVADADIVIAATGATFLDPHVSVGQVTAYEAIALVRKSPMEPVVRMALAGRYERLTAERLPAGHPQPGGRPARATPRGGPGAGRDHRPQLAGRHGRHQAGPVGRARAGLTDACRAGGGGAGVDVGPPGPGGGPPGLRREARAGVATSSRITGTEPAQPTEVQ